MVAHFSCHYGDVIMGEIASQITSFTIVYSTVYSDADQWKHQSSASLAFAWGIHRGLVNSPHKCAVTRKMFPFDDVIMVGDTLTSESYKIKTIFFQIFSSMNCNGWMARTVYIEANTSPKPKALKSSYGVLTHLGPKLKWGSLCRRYFETHFLEWKSINFDYDLIEVCS